MLHRIEDRAPPAGRRDAIPTVTADTFAQLVLAAEGPIAVEFMSYGCPHSDAGADPSASGDPGRGRREDLQGQCRHRPRPGPELRHQRHPNLDHVSERARSAAHRRPPPHDGERPRSGESAIRLIESKPVLLFNGDCGVCRLRRPGRSAPALWLRELRSPQPVGEAASVAHQEGEAVVRRERPSRSGPALQPASDRGPRPHPLDGRPSDAEDFAKARSRSARRAGWSKCGE
jgi:hypothetical protein